MDRFNIRVLDLEGGKRWLRHVIDADRGTDASRRAAFSKVIEHPEMLVDGVVWSRTGPLPLASVLGSLIDRTSLEIKEQYARHELAARRFAPRADLYVGPTEDRGGASDILTRPMFPGRAPEPEALMRKALAELAMRDAREYIRYGVKKTDVGEKVDFEREKIFLFRTGDEDFMGRLFERMIESASWEGLQGKDDPSHGKARHVALVNDDHGFMVMARGKGHYNSVRHSLEQAIDSAFDGYPIPMTKVEIAYDKASEGVIEVFVPRGDPAIGLFEAYARHAIVLGDEVRLTVLDTPRLADKPLFFEYVPDAQREGWPEAKDEELWRVESRVPEGVDEDKGFDRRLIEDTSAEVFVEGGMGVYRMDPEVGGSFWRQLPAEERRPGRPIGFMAIGGPRPNVAVASMWSHVHSNLAMNPVRFM